MGNIFTNSGKTIGTDIRTDISNLENEIKNEEELIRKINLINDKHGLEGDYRHEFNKFLQDSLKKDKETLDSLKTEKAQKLLAMMKGMENGNLDQIDEISKMINSYMESTQRGDKKKKKKKKKNNNNKRKLSTRATKSTRSSLRSRY